MFAKYIRTSGEENSLFLIIYSRFVFYNDLLLDRLFEQLSRVSVHAGRRVSIDRNHWILSGLWTDETCYDAGIDSSNGFKLIARVMLELI